MTIQKLSVEGGGSVEVTYDPDGMWNVGHHVIPDMCDRHNQARQLLRPVDDAAAASFRSDLYRRTKELWTETVRDFWTRLSETEDRMRLLGEAVELAVLNHVRTEQLNVETLDQVAYRAEILEELS